MAVTSGSATFAAPFMEASSDRWMRRCLQLARLGASTAAPNPMVGAVLVRGDELLAEGWHRAPGLAHAERACLDAFGDGAVPADATMVVNLEPCAHHGRTPPCAELLVERGVRHVVVAHRDPFPAVNGQGLARLKAADARVTEGVLEQEARWLNRCFITAVERSRPYIILKWARSIDGFLDRHPRDGRGVQRITGPATDILVHRWRSEAQAILVGSRTVVNDDPLLDARLVDGRAPLRVAIDRGQAIPRPSRILDGTLPTLLVAARPRPDAPVDQLIIGDGDDPIDALLAELHRRQVRALLVEGGAELLGHFIRRGLWDEARVITGPVPFGAGTPAPRIGEAPARLAWSDDDRISYHVNAAQQPLPHDAWPW